jgi:flagellar assembly factor FliW
MSAYPSVAAASLPGPVTVDAGAVVTMVAPMPGFESCRKFVVAVNPDLAPFTALSGVDESTPAFLAVDPRLVLHGYDTPLDDTVRHQLGAAPGDTLLWLALVRATGDRALVNLRAPIVINPQQMRGVQLVPPDSPYSTDHPLCLD